MKHVIKIALVLLAGVAAYFVYGFTVQVAPPWIAGLAAGSLVGTYLGLAFADIPEGQQVNAVRVAWAAMGVEAVYGTLFVLSLQYPAFFHSPPWWAAVPLAALHGGAFSVLAFFVSLFIFHAQRGAVAAGSPEERVALILAEALRPVLMPAQPAALPEPDATYARAQQQPTPEAAQPVLTLPEACPACGTEPTKMQARTAKQHGGWSCKGCGKRVSAQ